MNASEARAAQQFQDVFGADPTVVGSAPGRINLIGEHTDYNEGFVLPIAIDRQVAAAVGTGDDRAYSADFGELDSLTQPSAASWTKYVAGVVWAMKKAGIRAGEIRLALAGDVPVGAGLSSSAATECSVALALDHFFRNAIDRKELAAICRSAENEFVGVQSGIMDQFASLFGQRGHALFLDCRSLEHRLIPFRLAEHGLALLVCNTGSARELAASGYNERRVACSRAARSLGLTSLRDARVEDLANLSGVELKRARHVITENARVLQAVEALEQHDFPRFGRLMFESHASLRDDYEVSTPELDLFVETARERGALGARLTGAGFGGCAISLIEAGVVAGVKEATVHEFIRRGFSEPLFYEFAAADGARTVEFGT